MPRSADILSEYIYAADCYSSIPIALCLLYRPISQRPAARRRKSASRNVVITGPVRIIKSKYVVHWMVVIDSRNIDNIANNTEASVLLYATRSMHMNYNVD